MRHGQAKDVVRLSEITNKFIPIFELDRKIWSFDRSQGSANWFFQILPYMADSMEGLFPKMAGFAMDHIFSLQIIDL
jgi:hypothetical protein